MMLLFYASVIAYFICFVGSLNSENFDGDPNLSNDFDDWWWCKKNESEECAHAKSTFGRKFSGDFLTHMTTIKKPNRIFRASPIEYEYLLRGPQVQNCFITSLDIENLYKKCDCFNEAIKIIDGGIGKKSIKVEVTNGINCPNQRTFTVFTACNHTI